RLSHPDELRRRSRIATGFRCRWTIHLRESVEQIGHRLQTQLHRGQTLLQRLDVLRPLVEPRNGHLDQLHLEEKAIQRCPQVMIDLVEEAVLPLQFEASGLQLPFEMLLAGRVVGMGLIPGAEDAHGWIPLTPGSGSPARSWRSCPGPWAGTPSCEARS